MDLRAATVAYAVGHVHDRERWPRRVAAGGPLVVCRATRRRAPNCRSGALTRVHGAAGRERSGEPDRAIGARRRARCGQATRTDWPFGALPRTAGPRVLVSRGRGLPVGEHWLSLLDALCRMEARADVSGVSAVVDGCTVLVVGGSGSKRDRRCLAALVCNERAKTDVTSGRS